MKNQVIKFKGTSQDYSIFIGNNTLNLLSKKIKLLCPKTKKVALVIDNNIPKKFRTIIKKQLKNYKILILPFTANEKNKSLVKVDYYLNKILSKNFNRSDLIIGLGGGITGDVAGFVASILFK